MDGKDKRNRSGLIKIIILLCLLSALIGGLAVYWFAVRDTEGRLVITNLDVGKADCAVIQYKETAGIIDTATEDAYGIIDAFLKEKKISSFEYMILTHYDRDHIGSAVKILDKYEVKKVFIPDYVSEKKYYKGLMEKLEGREGVITVSGTEETFDLQGISIRVIPAADPEALKEYENNYDNNMSLLTMRDYDGKRFLFTGDIEKQRISQIIESGEDIKADWIKMPHHGSYEKRINKFLKQVSPLYSVISTSEDHPPDEKLLEVIEKNNIENFDTMNGNIVTVCDGEDITVHTE